MGGRSWHLDSGGVTRAETSIHLSPADAVELLKGDADAIDVRTDHEWDAGRIGGARHVEVNDVNGAAETIARDHPVVFYCHTGSRSGMVAEAFRGAGWDAFHIEGGIAAWADAGLPLEPPDGEIVSQAPR